MPGMRLERAGAEPAGDGLVQQFSRAALDEFFCKAFREKLYSNAEEMQADFDNWFR